MTQCTRSGPRSSISASSAASIPASSPSITHRNPCRSSAVTPAAPVAEASAASTATSATSQAGSITRNTSFQENQSVTGFRMMPKDSCSPVLGSLPPQ